MSIKFQIEFPSIYSGWRWKQAIFLTVYYLFFWTFCSTLMMTINKIISHKSKSASIVDSPLVPISCHPSSSSLYDYLGFVPLSLSIYISRTIKNMPRNGSVSSPLCSFSNEIKKKTVRWMRGKQSRMPSKWHNANVRN